MPGDKNVRAAAAGALAGLAAAFLMNRFQQVWSKASQALSSDGGEQEGGGSGEQATTLAAEKLHDAVSDRPLTKRQKDAAGSAVHYAFGMSTGGLYGVLGRRWPGVRALNGMAYGAALSLVADEGLVPLAGLSPPPAQVPVKSHVFGFVSHLVFGAALEVSRRIIAGMDEKRPAAT